jgi:hypothetical protein
MQLWPIPESNGAPALICLSASQIADCGCAPALQGFFSWCHRHLCYLNLNHTRLLTEVPTQDSRVPRSDQLQLTPSRGRRA